MADSFLQKPIGVISLIGSAIVGPYVYFGGTQAPPHQESTAAQTSPAQVGYPSQMASPAYLGEPGYPPSQGQSSGPALTNAPIADFREVLRFDITPAWVPQHFARVTTVLGNTRLDGLRVPFVSGTQPTDVAGSLTYYFDAQQSPRRIQMIGVCGDPTILVNLMLQYYHLQAEPSLGGHLYTSRWNNRVTSVMQLTPAPVIVSHDTHRRFQVFLELNQPSMEYALTPEAEQILHQASLNQRW